MPEGIPKDLLDKSACVVVYPSVKKAAFVVGASYGRGVITCRSGKNSTVHGVRPPCLLSKEAVSASRSAPKPPTSCC